MIKGLTSASRGVGASLADKPEFRNLLLGESLKISSKILEKKGSKRTERTMKQFIEKQNDYIQPFVEKINTVNKLYNQPIELIFDKENLYIETKEGQQEFSTPSQLLRS
ncbi:hypothetical protein ACIQ2D_21010 [Lysinibacillus sp. NPDC097287]|uniref:hypothetical protein n=1 Tax=Lysinibacillus sp. NPDC097287 TaxID=3364144 RepID=UPI0038247E20